MPYLGSTDERSWTAPLEVSPLQHDVPSPSEIEDTISKFPFHPEAADSAMIENKKPTFPEYDQEPKFKLFPKLPLELRRAIWQFSLPDSRCIIIETSYLPAPSDSASIISSTFTNRSIDEESDLKERSKESELDDEDEELWDGIDGATFEIEGIDGNNYGEEDEIEDELDNNVQKLSEDNDDSIEEDSPRLLWRAICVERVPGIFFTCHEAMTAVEERYKPMKGSDGSGAVWCDPKEDVICLRDSGSCVQMSFSQLPYLIRVNITHMAVYSLLALLLCYFDEADLRWLPGLKRITLTTNTCPRDAIVELRMPDKNAKIINSADQLGDRDTEDEAYQMIHEQFTRILQQQPDWKAPIVTNGATFIPEYARR